MRTPVHPLRHDVFIPRVVAYALVAGLFLYEAEEGTWAACLFAWALLMPWLLRIPVPNSLHGALHVLEYLTMPLLAIFAGIPLLVLGLALLPFLLGLFSLYGARAGLTCLAVWALGVGPVAVWRPPMVMGSDIGLIAAGVLAVVFALAVATLSYVQTRRLVVTRSELAARVAREAALAKQLSSYLPPAVHQVAFESEVAASRSRRCWLTVCFADLVGFTELTDVTESEEVVAMLDDFYIAMAGAARAQGGTLDKYIGDAVMIFFGDEPASYSERYGNAGACVSMALDMQGRFDALQARWRTAGIVRPPALRIGIHSGWCTVGVFGPVERRAYTVIGSTVNIASRIETAAAPGQILISHATWLLLAGEFTGRCQRLDPLYAKGLRDPLETFQVSRNDLDAPLELVLDGLALRLEPGSVNPHEARAALESALQALPAELSTAQAGAG